MWKIWRPVSGLQSSSMTVLRVFNGKACDIFGLTIFYEWTTTEWLHLNSELEWLGSGSQVYQAVCDSPWLGFDPCSSWCLVSQHHFSSGLLVRWPIYSLIAHVYILVGQDLEGRARINKEISSSQMPLWEFEHEACLMDVLCVYSSARSVRHTVLNSGSYTGKKEKKGNGSGSFKVSCQWALIFVQINWQIATVPKPDTVKSARLELVKDKRKALAEPFANN